MLKRFSVCNFKNFRDGLSFVLDAPAPYGFNTEIVQSGMSTKGLIYGVNGSGKSNLGLALFDIVVHLTDKERTLSRYLPYQNPDSMKPAAEFEYVFEFDSCEVVYQYAKTSATDLVYERLAIGGTEVLQYDFERRSGYVNLAGARSLQITSTLPDATDTLSRVKFVSTHAILQDNAINRAFRSLMSFIKCMLLFHALDQWGYQGLTVGFDTPAQGIVRAGKVDELKVFLQERGLEFDLIPVDVQGRQELYCRYRGESVPFTSVASTGTKSLMLFYYWYISLSRASLVFIDDFDAFYFFDLAWQMVKLLKGLRDTQILLTTHNTELLSNDLLRPDAYFYLRSGSIACLHHLTDKEMRYAHNLQKMFTAGLFDE